MKDKRIKKKTAIIKKTEMKKSKHQRKSVKQVSGSHLNEVIESLRLSPLTGYLMLPVLFCRSSLVPLPAFVPFLPVLID